MVIKTEPGRRVKQHAMTYLADNHDDFVTTRSCEQYLGFVLHCYEPFNNQIWQNGRPACTDLTLQV